MGSYLRKPITEKVSEDESTELVKYGASSMQGWRISQEDAHNCCPKFDESNGSLLFAVYDGHGGAEVAEYASKKLPDFLKALPQYKEGNLKEALVDTFLGFDLELLKPEVIDELKQLAGVQSDDEEQDEEEAEMLCEEADMPLDRLMERYGGSGAAPAVQNLRQKEKFQSPMLRPKRDGGDEAAEAGSAPGECDAGGGGDAVVKTKLEDALLNGHDACGDSKVDSTQCDTNEAVSAKAEKAKDTNEGSAHNGVDTVDSTVADEDSPKSKAAALLAGSVENEAASGCSSSADAVGSASNSNAGRVDSAAQGSSSSAPDSAGSAPKSSGGSGSSAPDSSGSTPTSAKSQQADSGISTEPCSSSGRVRRNRRGVIPEEDESESSFDEDEEDTDEDDSDDDPEPWKTGEDEDDSDEEGLEGEGAFPGEVDGDEDDEEEEEVMCGGNEQPGEDSGCTAVVALVHNRQLLVSNAGDSRCVVCRGGQAIDMSVDHKPEDPEEQQRITLAGGRVTMDGRVNGGLNLSRALGDHCYKKNEDLSQREQMITALPDVKTIDLEDSDEFMVLACDGIWNVMSSQDVVGFVRDRIQAGVTKLSSICEELFDVCLAPDTTGDGTGCDNMTCIIVSLQRDGESPTKVKDESLSQVDQEDTVAASTKRKAETGTSEAEAAPDCKRTKLEEESK